MNITDIRIRSTNLPGKLRAVVSITLDDMFVVHDIKLIDGANGMFIAMPSRKIPSGEFKDIAHPLTNEARELLQNKIIAAYLEKTNAQPPEQSDENG